MPCVIDMKIAKATSLKQVTSLVANTQIVDKAIDAIPRSRGMNLSGILLF